MKLQPMVLKKRGKTRKGKGSSRGELREAGLDSRQALKLGISIDLRRKTKREENVETLKQHLRSLSSKKKAKSRAVKYLDKEHT
ncbi:MAG: 50S ribosomal protein L13e [Candidatus Bathyarchaeota archaeon BA2]|nr:MAG: 50S ribosomal protein L13e [Candidatus Bathyarchaeota archaeon BA2]